MVDATITETPWYVKSKTLIINALVVVITLAAAFMDVFPKEWAVYITIALAVANLALRWITQGSITITPEDAAQLADIVKVATKPKKKTVTPKVKKNAAKK